MKILKTVGKYVILIYLIYLVPTILVNNVFSFFDKTMVLGKYVCSIVLTNILLVCAAIIIKNKKNISFSELDFKLNKKNTYYLCIIMIASIGFYMFNRLIYVMPAFKSSLEAVPNGFTVEMVNSLNHSIGWMVLTCVLIPICEELFFRGIVLNDLIKQYGWIKGIIWGSAIFSFFHVSTFIFVFPAFLVVGYVYYKKKNIIYPMVFHISNNIFAALLGDIVKDWQSADIVRITVIGIIIIVLSVFLLYKDERAIKK